MAVLIIAGGLLLLSFLVIDIGLPPSLAPTSPQEQTAIQLDRLPSDVEPGSPNAVLSRHKRLNQELMPKLLNARDARDFEGGAALLRARATALRAAITDAEGNRTWSHADQQLVISVLRQELHWAEEGADAISP